METVICTLENLCCANCAAKIEEKINQHPQVSQAVLTFATRQLRLTAQDPQALLPELEKIARTVEEDVTIRLREEDHREQHHHEHCGCGHDHHEHSDSCGCGHHHHEHSDSCGCGHDHHDHGKEEKLWPLLVGGGLFVLGLFASGLPQTLLCLTALALLGWEILGKAIRSLFRGHVLDENFLMSAAAIGAFFIGNAPEGVGVMLFYRLGEYFEHRAVERSRSQIMEAIDLRPETVTLVDGDALRTIPAAQARIGDLLLVRPGDRVPLDGTVVSGESRLDTAPITGEPVPVRVQPGDSVISGCVNTLGQLTIRADKPLGESMVTRILNSVENAAAGKPRIDRFITRFARIYTPVVVAVSLLTAVIPSMITGDWNYWVYTALSFLVMSCPCALVLSVPLAFFAGIGAGSKKGILFKGGASMEAMGKIKAVVMDKTGTLTQGDFRVKEVQGDADLLRLCAACEEHSTHPIAASILAEARDRQLAWPRPQALQELPGKGIRATVEGREVLVGNEALLSDHGIAVPAHSQVYGTRVYAAVDGRFAGTILISDTIKPDALQAVEALTREGYVCHLLTGDAQEAAQAVARELKIPRCHGSLLPQDKLDRLQAIRREAGGVMFVGDGINDAPVLAGADVGCAMGSGADAAIEAADVVFMTAQARAIPESLAIARKTARIAWQNVIFALAVKVLVMVLGMLGYASMWMAVFADSGVAMLCVLNSIRLLYKK